MHELGVKGNNIELSLSHFCNELYDFSNAKIRQSKSMTFHRIKECLGNGNPNYVNFALACHRPTLTMKELVSAKMLKLVTFEIYLIVFIQLSECGKMWISLNPSVFTSESTILWQGVICAWVSHASL